MVTKHYVSRSFRFVTCAQAKLATGQEAASATVLFYSRRTLSKAKHALMRRRSERKLLQMYVFPNARLNDYNCAVAGACEAN